MQTVERSYNVCEFATVAFGQIVIGIGSYCHDFGGRHLSSRGVGLETAVEKDVQVFGNSTDG